MGSKFCTFIYRKYLNGSWSYQITVPLSYSIWNISSMGSVTKCCCRSIWWYIDIQLVKLQDFVIYAWQEITINSEQAPNTGNAINDIFA